MSSAIAITKKQIADALPAAALQKLQQTGLVLTSIVADGQIHRCGVVGKEQGTDGAYLAFSDSPACVWGKNWRTDDEATWRATASSKLTQAERNVMKRRLADKSAFVLKEQNARYANAAKNAAKIWAECQAAQDTHPYLQRKSVRSFGLRTDANGRLVVPVYDAKGALQSLQFILPEKPEDGTDKRFLAGGKTAGGFFLIPAKDGSENGPLLIAEGYATAASLNMATGFACLVAFNCGNLCAVAKIAREKHPRREIILCADNDCENVKPDGTPCNPGEEAAQKAAVAISASLVLCPRIDGGKADFNDLHTRKGLLDVQTAITTTHKKADVCPMPEGFFLKPEGRRGAGLYWLNTKGNGEPEEIRLGPPLNVLGRTRDADGNNWGLMLEWKDPDGLPHRWAMPAEMLSRKMGVDWFEILLSGGWTGVPSLRNKMGTFLASVSPVRRIRCVSRVGWHNGSFVLPDTVYGADAGCVVLQPASLENVYGTGGSMEGWQKLAALASGNSRMEFAIYAALAGPFLRVAGMESGGFNLVGVSSTGKSTALKLAASVWGGSGYVRSWRTTDNALEGMAVLHNDALLVLDEIGQAPARVVSEAAYMLSNGMGKARAGKDGNTRKPHCWRLMFLSSGEAGLAERLAEIGQRVKAGQEVRLVDIPVDAGKGMRGFDVLNGKPSASALSILIQRDATTNYGHAGRALVRAMTEDDGTLAEGLRDNLGAFVNRICPKDADGQVRRVAMRFALCAAAGCYAINAGILPATFKPEETMERLFGEWLAARGGAGASEDAAILSAVRLFIENHGASRFEDLGNQTGQRVMNRVGFKRTGDSGNTEYIVLPESFKAEVVTGFNAKRARKVLFDAGWLQARDKGHYQTLQTLPEMGRVRTYVLTLPTEPETE